MSIIFGYILFIVHHMFIFLAADFRPIFAMHFRNPLCHIFGHLRECGRGEGAKQYCNRGQTEDRLEENERERKMKGEGGRHISRPNA